MDERQEALRLRTRPVAMAGIKPNHHPKPGPLDNTTGVVLPKTEPNTAGTSSNPPVKPVTEAGKGFLERNKEALQKAIDDFVEARPDSTLAKMAGASATAVDQVFFPEAAWELIPAGKVAKLLKKGAEAAGIVKKVDKVEDAAQVARKAPEPKAAQGSGGGYVKPPKRMKPHDVRCFKKNKKGDPKEYDRQLADQERGLNDMTVKEYLDGRQRYLDIGRQGTGAAQRTAREKFQAELAGQFRQELNEQGVMGAAAVEQAASKAAARMHSLAALHTPDLVAGGKDIVGGLGDRGVNNSIGSQWKDRVSELDVKARNVPEAERGNTKMNAKLKRCK